MKMSEIVTSSYEKYGRKPSLEFVFGELKGAEEFEVTGVSTVASLGSGVSESYDFSKKKILLHLLPYLTLLFPLKF